MFKVYYTEEHYFVANGEDGQFDFVVMKGDMVENGIDIRISEGSMRPPNKTIQQKWVSDLVSAGMIDPLTVYEVAAGGNMPSPSKMLERFMMFKTDPAAFIGKSKEDDFSREALMDIQILNSGKMPDVRSEYSPVYLKFVNNYMLSGEFEKQSMAAKAGYVQYLRVVQTIMAQQMAKLMTQMPTQDEVAAQNQSTAQQAALEGQIAGALPQPGGEPGAAPGGSSGAPAAAGPDQLAQQMAGARSPAPAM